MHLLKPGNAYGDTWDYYVIHVDVVPVTFVVTFTEVFYEEYITKTNKPTY